MDGHSYFAFEGHLGEKRLNVMLWFILKEADIVLSVSHCADM